MCPEMGFFQPEEDEVKVYFGQVGNKEKLLLDTPKKRLYTEGLGACVAIATYDPETQQGSLAHIMVQKIYLKSYIDWVKEKQLLAPGIKVALVGGSNFRSQSKDCYSSSKELVEDI